jgi:hypothetical protein
MFGAGPPDEALLLALPDEELELDDDDELPHAATRTPTASVATMARIQPAMKGLSSP